MEKVVVDLLKGGAKRTVPGELKVSLAHHGMWAIDKVSGKIICLLELVLPSEGITLNFPTTHEFCESYVYLMLEAEYKNDHFEFPTPAMNRFRPQELEPKIRRLQKVLDGWRERLPHPQTPPLF